MMTLTVNPYSWDNSSLSVTSRVCSLELKNEETGTINVSDLENDIEITIPNNNEESESAEKESRFLKPYEMTISSYYDERNVAMSISLEGVDKDAIVEVFVKSGSKPTVEDYDQSFAVAFTATCQNGLSEGDYNITYCAVEQFSFTVPPSGSTVTYVGMVLHAEKNATEHSRKRRSCLGHGREKRSCIGTKDPPPNGYNKTVIPQYDSSTDVKYTMSISQTSCLYWSQAKEKWASDGCKVISYF